MKESRFTKAQIVTILKEADAGMKVADIYHKHAPPTRPTATGNRSAVAWRPRI